MVCRVKKRQWGEGGTGVSADGSLRAELMRLRRHVWVRGNGDARGSIRTRSHVKIAGNVRLLRYKICLLFNANNYYETTVHETLTECVLCDNENCFH